MRRSGIYTLYGCIALLCASLLPPASNAANDPPFPDMAKSWYGYQDSVEYLVSKGSIDGYPDGNFHPKETVNRAEFLKLVFRSRGAVEPASGNCFADVPADAWYAPYVCAAKHRGIISGYKVGSRAIFKADQPILFSEAIKIMLLSYGDKVAEGKGGQWFQPYVDELDKKQILNAASYIPWQPIDRERAADLIARFLRNDTDRVIPNLSPGCGKSAKAPSLTLSINGQDRTYLLDIPRAMNTNTPAPLIIAFHGRTNSNEQVRQYYGLDRAATGYFVAYPAAIAKPDGTFSWSETDDLAFFDSMVREISNSYCVDMDRIFVVGHSLGAYFADSVACIRGGVVRGSATVGGSVSMKHCDGPSAAMIINNPHDTLSPQAASEAMRDQRIAANTCSSTFMSVEPSSLSCTQYAGCSLNPVVFCPDTIDYENSTYYPHVWPPGTGEAIVKFFNGL